SSMVPLRPTTSSPSLVTASLILSVSSIIPSPSTEIFTLSIFWPVTMGMIPSSHVSDASISYVILLGGSDAKPLSQLGTPLDPGEGRRDSNDVNRVAHPEFAPRQPLGITAHR